MLPKILQLIPEYRDYLWGGARLRPGIVPTAEAWLIYEQDRVALGPLAGRTLKELAEVYGSGLIGARAQARNPGRFPLLIKLIDSLEWLSLQVHPNDAEALQLEGPGFNGKNEAYHVLASDGGPNLIAGLCAGVTQADLESALRNGTINDLARYLEVCPGDTLYMPAGTIHALGPGLLIYEVQQSSDITYRVYDWGRPQTATRKLHIDQSLAVADLGSAPQPLSLPTLADGVPATLCQSPNFRLETIFAHTASIELDTGGETFHALTIVEGRARLVAGDEVLQLEQYQSALIPAATHQYRLEPRGEFRLLIASV
jgi:mannose-6-phosphate isomerase